MERIARRVCLPLVAVLAGLGTLATAPATAGTYTIDQCRVPGQSASVKGVMSDWWTGQSAGGGPVKYDTCGNGGSFGYDLSRTPAGAIPYGHAYYLGITAPAGISITRLETRYRVPSHSGPSAYLEIFSGAGTAVYGEQLPADHIAGTPVSINFAGGTSGFYFRHFCSTDAGAINCSYASWAQVLRIDELRLTASESGAPAASIDGGTLTTGGAKSGVRSVALSASDALSGVERIDVRLGATVVATLDYGADPMACPRDSWAACERDRPGRSVDVDTTLVPDGVHELSIVVTDAAGNTRTVPGGEVTVDNVPPPAPVAGDGPRVSAPGGTVVGATLEGERGTWSGEDVSHALQWQRCDADGGACADIAGATTDRFTLTSRDAGHRLRLRVTGSNREGSTAAVTDPTAAVSSPPADPDRVSGGASPGGDRGEPNGSGASDRARLAAYVGRSRRSTVRTRHGRSVRISGRLLDPSNRPIAGARLAVSAQPQLRGAEFEDLGTARTGADGTFSYVLPAGPSRLVRIGYRSHTGDVEFADTTEVVVLVRAGIALRAAPRRVRNGRVATFSGRVARPVPVRGVLVDLQARVGRSWRTFAVVRTTRAGRYRHRHRFRHTFVTTTFRFRARVRRESEYPYLIGHSRVARLRVRP